MRIDIGRLQFNDKDAFACGGYGAVYRAVFLNDGDEEQLSTPRVVAVKFVKYASYISRPWTVSSFFLVSVTRANPLGIK